jgi:hydroxypyruvate reductase
VTLIVSDVLGDPLHLIASGPTVESTVTPSEAREILERYGARAPGISARVFDALDRRQAVTPAQSAVSNLVIGNNAVAVAAAAARAAQLGYTPKSESAMRSEGSADDVGRRLADEAIVMRTSSGPDCLVSGGEPTVKLVESERRGLGGRNQQLVLAALERLQRHDLRGIVILSGGTDGEDGPTDAAGAWASEQVLTQARQLNLDPADYLARNDSYRWFEQVGSLLKTGPTNTNVCDVRVVLVARKN